MKKTVIAFFASLVVAGTAFAGSTYYAADTKSYKQTYEEPFTCFADQEFQLDLFGSYVNTDGRPDYGDGFGGGIGLNFFFQRYVGIGVSGNVADTSPELWNIDSSIILRYPIDEICLAPYIFGGGGWQVDGEGEWTGHAGGGLEYRVVPNSLGLFAEGRYIWGELNDSVQTRVGVRVVF